MQGSLDVAESGRVLDIPVVGDLQTFLPGDQLSPAQLEQTLRVDVVAQIVEDAVLHEGHPIERISSVSRQLHQVLGHVQIGSLVRSADVVNQPDLRLEEHDLKGSRHVLHEQEVPLVGAGAVQGHLAASHQLVDELRDELLRVLMGSVHVVTPGDYYRHAEGSVVRLG